MKNVWSPASCSALVRASIQPSASSIKGANCPSRRGTPSQCTIGGRREAKRDLLLLAAEQTHGERAGLPQQLVQRRLLPDRDTDERWLERERDERGDCDAHPVAVVIDCEYGDVV